jgi:hypothetical protein
MKRNSIKGEFLVLCSLVVGLINIMKWSMDHVLTWCFMTEIVLTVDLYRLINSC